MINCAIDKKTVITECHQSYNQANKFFSLFGHDFLLTSKGICKQSQLILANVDSLLRGAPFWGGLGNTISDSEWDA